MSSSNVVMEGFMMKRKGGGADNGASNGGRSGSRRGLFRRSISLKWVTRYFVLHRDGRLVYYKDRPSNGSNEGESVGDDSGTVICVNFTECDVVPVAPSDVERDPANNVANSFYVTNNYTQATTLLVTNGPGEYKRWMSSFRELKAAGSRAAEEMALAKEAATAKAAAAPEEVAAANNAAAAAGSDAAEAALAAAWAKKRAEEKRARVEEEERLMEREISAASAERDRLEKEELERLEKERFAAAEKAAEEDRRREAEESLRLERERIAEEQRVAQEEERRHREEEEENFQKLVEEAKAAAAAARAAQAVTREKKSEEEGNAGEGTATGEPFVSDEGSKSETNEQPTAPSPNDAAMRGEDTAKEGVEKIATPTEPPAAVKKIPSVKSLKENRRKALQTIMRDRSLGKDERKRRMDEVKEEYDQRILEAEAQAHEARLEDEKKKEVSKEGGGGGEGANVATEGQSAGAPSEGEGWLSTVSEGAPTVEPSKKQPTAYSQSNAANQGKDNDKEGGAPKTAVELPPVAAEKIILSVKSLEESRRKELQTIMRDRSLGKDERKRRMDEVKEQYDQLIMQANEARGDGGEGATTQSDAHGTMEEESKPESQAGDATQENAQESKEDVDRLKKEKEREVASIEHILDDDAQGMGHVDGRLHCVHAGKDGKELAEKVAAAEDQRNCYEKALANQEVIVDMIDDFSRMTEFEIGMAAKVFACGCTFDEMKKALLVDGAKKVLYGILVTSLREMTNAAIGEKEELSGPLVAFSLEHEGGNADTTEVKKFKNHFDLIQSWIKTQVSFNEIHHMAYSAGNSKNGILERLGLNEEGDDKEDSPQPTEESVKFDPSTYSDTGKTAYNRALEVFGPDNVPSGDELLEHLRQPRGFPYNWVLFEPSKKELVVKDAGSGGVMELTKLLQEDNYDDKVLFGYIRLSFSADQVGRRQFWVGLEWKGENCFGVRAMRQSRECSGPMAKMIGDRSFTLSNVAASDMTLEMFVSHVKRSCNVKDFKVTVETMENAHIMEQNEIKEYWKNYESEQEAEEKRKREAEAKRLRLRQEKIESLRKSRKSRWSEMGAAELLGDLGKNDACGWALLEF